MDVQELFLLSEWYEGHFPRLRELYTALHNVLENNASQPNQQPVEQPLDELSAYLGEMNLGELSLQQLSLLEELDVRILVGIEGKNFVENTVKTSTYDPATTEQKIQASLQSINETNGKLSAYKSAVASIGIEPDSFEDLEGRITVRIGFKNQASIENVTQWKSSSKEWYDIVRGIAMAAGESPEDTKVIGASKGSIILILASTYTVTKLLATISKHVTGIAKDVISVGIERENLRQKKLLTKTMDAELTKFEKEKRESGLKEITGALEQMLPDSVQGDVKTALESSVKKILSFNEKGGDVDFVSPPANEDIDGDPEDGEEIDEVQAEISQVRQIIQEYQEEREVVRLLEDHTQEDS